MSSVSVRVNSRSVWQSVFHLRPSAVKGFARDNRQTLSVARLCTFEIRPGLTELALALRPSGNRPCPVLSPPTYSFPIRVRCPTGSPLLYYAHEHRSRVRLSFPRFSVVTAAD